MLLAVTTRAGAVDYLQDIKPILSQNCYQCHGATQQKGGLRLDTAVSALKGGEKGSVIEPGKSSASLLIALVSGPQGDLPQMPYKKRALSEAQINTLKAWIDDGAKAPKDEKPEAQTHWSFIAPKRPELPVVKQKSWVRNPIDNFILARLEKEGIQPSAEADKVTLIRRLSLDLIGLPPTIKEVQDFLKDTRKDAYEQLVDRLLASPHYGERAGRIWLDEARYADSNGYSIDAPRKMWRYRDWVINALNRDMPFDEFTIEQLAGDMLPNATAEQKIATGFHRNTQINEEGGIDKEQFRIESIIDRVNTTGTVFLGLTIGCCQCHDHKFDPLTQKEYYRMFAFLNNADEPSLELGTPEEIKARDAMRTRMRKAESDARSFKNSLNNWLINYEKELTEEKRKQLSPEVNAALTVPLTERTDEQKKLIGDAFRPVFDAKLKELSNTAAKLKKETVPLTTAFVMQERKQPRESYLFIKGDFTRHGPVVTPGTPGVLPPLPESPEVTRLDLAKWLVAPENPLTARVAVNRLWQQHFGRGIVETDNDFGTQGIPPTHPELLDWLATELLAKKWSLKEMHRLMVTSATYRQASKARPDLALVDANNKLLARQTRLRLDAELVRDMALSASGLLTDKIGGPSVFPPQPDGVMTLGQSKRDWKADTNEDRFRRGMYTFFWRATPNPALMVFDTPDAMSTCTRRLRSNTPLQALTLLNDESFFEFAQGLAVRILKEAPANDAARFQYAYKLCVAREPTKNELTTLSSLLKAQLATYESAPDDAKSLVASNAPKEQDVKQLAAWTTVSRVLLNLDETITRE